jgi:Uma2 family endonuclease
VLPTRNHNWSQKLRGYRTLPSFREYLLIARNEIRAEHYVRQADDSLVFRELNGPETEIRLESIGCRLQLGSLYRKVKFA